MFEIKSSQEKTTPVQEITEKITDQLLNTLQPYEIADVLRGVHGYVKEFYQKKLAASKEELEILNKHCEPLFNL